jgi:hypothetical protein
MSYSLIVLPAVARELAEIRAEREQRNGRAVLAEFAAVFGKIRERPRRYPIA